MDSPAAWRRSSAAAGEDGLSPIDWPGLCARLSVAAQLRRAMAPSRRSAARAGSFAQPLARVVFAGRSAAAD